MDLISYNTEDLSSLRPNDYFFEPSSRKIYQYRNKEGKAIIVREVGTQNISKLFKNTLKTVLKVEGGFDKYQVINISDTSITLFNANIGESFELGFGDASDSIEVMQNSFKKGDEIVAEVFDYDEIKEIISLSVTNASVSQNESIISDAQVSEVELQRVKEIEEKKAKKRPFVESDQAKPTPKVSQPIAKTQSKSASEENKKEKAVVRKEEKKVVTPSKIEEKKGVTPSKIEEKKVETPPKKEEKKETKEEKKEREKREKEEQKAREKTEKEAKKGKKEKK